MLMNYDTGSDCTIVLVAHEDELVMFVSFYLHELLKCLFRVLLCRSRPDI
jgi:hypothetical protein